MSLGRELLQKALTSTEQQDYIQALKYTDEALIAFQQANDIDGFAETWSARFHTFKHLYQSTQWQPYAVSALNAAQTGVSIAEQANQTTSYGITYINLAKAYDLLGEVSKAIETYQKAIQYLPQSPTHNRPAVIADTQSHLDALLLAQGDQAAEDRILANIELIRNAKDISAYERDVWISGAYLRMVKVFQKTDSTKAQNYLTKAKSVIENNPELVIRKDQIQKITRS